MRSCTFYLQKTSQKQQSKKEICIQNCQGNLQFRYVFWEATWQMNVLFVWSHSSLILLVNYTSWFELGFKSVAEMALGAKLKNPSGVWPQEVPKPVSSYVYLTLIFISFIWFWDILVCGSLAAFIFKFYSFCPVILCC